MAESLATEGDLLSSTQITGGALRDYFLTLIHANDRRYSETFVQSRCSREDEKVAVRDLIDALDEKSQERHILTRELLDALDEKTAQRFTALENLKETRFHEYGGMLEALKAKTEERFIAAEMISNTRMSDLMERSKAVVVDYNSIINALADKTAQRFTALEHVKEVMFHDQEVSIAKAHIADQQLLDARLESLRNEALLSTASVKDSIVLALSSAKEAVAKAEAANEKRFDSVNEFRATLTDQQRTFMPRSELEVIIKSLNEKVSAQAALLMDSNNRINANQANIAGKESGQNQGWGWAVGVVGLVLTLLSIVGMFVVLNGHKDTPAPVYQVGAPASPVYQVTPPASVQSK